MDIEKICEMFEEISGESAEENLTVIKSAAAEVLSMLKSENFRFREEVEILAAATANLRFCEKELSREKHAVTLSGGVTSAYPDNSRVENARGYLEAQKKACRNLISTDGFVFVGIRG